MAKRRGFAAVRKHDQGPEGWVRRRTPGTSLAWKRGDILANAQNKMSSLQSQIINGLAQGNVIGKQ